MGLVAGCWHELSRTGWPPCPPAAGRATLHMTMQVNGGGARRGQRCRRGYDARHTPLGSGQRNMADRLAALGGRLEVQAAPGQGTTVTGHLPAPLARQLGPG